MFRWTVTFETAVIARGTAETRAEAERAAATAQTAEVMRGLNPDSLAWHVHQAGAR